MSTTTQVKKVKINKMSKARYEQTTPVATELYMLTDVLDPQYDVLPTADAKYADQITQYTGASVDGGYTNGYFYKCTAQGTTPETYAWEQTDVQPSRGGGLPDQTGNAGKFLTTDGTDASWGTTVSDTLSAIDTTATATDKVMLTLGVGTQTSYRFHIYTYRVAARASFAIGDKKILNLYQYSVEPNSNNTIDLGGNNTKWKNVYTIKLNNGADINVPTTGGTMAVIQTPSTTPTLTVAGWSNKSQTISVTGVTASNVVLVSPAPTSASDYAAAGIICTAQASGSLTFTCETVPTSAIDLSIVIL